MTKKKNHPDEKVSEHDSIKAEATNQEATEQNQANESEVSGETDPIAVLKQELDLLNDKYLRINAEYQNYRKRVEKEKTDILKYGTEKIFTELLTVMDNFERALSAVENDQADNKVLDGVKMIKKNFDDFFDRNGVKKIEAVNQPFDPLKHHAVMTVEGEDGQSETVLEVFQDGYVLNDKVIRPSMVKVAN